MVAEDSEEGAVEMARLMEEGGVHTNDGMDSEGLTRSSSLDALLQGDKDHFLSLWRTTFGGVGGRFSQLSDRAKSDLITRTPSVQSRFMALRDRAIVRDLTRSQVLLFFYVLVGSLFAFSTRESDYVEPWRRVDFFRQIVPHSLVRYWYLLVWAVGITICLLLVLTVLHRKQAKSRLASVPQIDYSTLLNSLVLSCLAGILEELHYRYILVETNMYIGHILDSWMRSSWLVGLMLMVVVGFAFITFWFKLNTCLKATSTALAIIWGYLWWRSPFDWSLVLWFQSIIRQVQNVLTFYIFDDILGGKSTSGLDEWLVYSISCSAQTFSESHGYQGFVGRWNTLLLAFFFTRVTLDDGLPTAMVLHAMYDCVVMCLQWSLRHRFRSLDLDRMVAS